MNLITKSALIIVGNVIVSFAVGLLAREYLLNPALLEIERQTDQRDVDRFDRALQHYQHQMQARVAGLAKLAGQTTIQLSGDAWSEWVDTVAGGQIDYLLISDPNAEYTQVAFINDERPHPSPPQAMQAGLAKVLERLRESERRTVTGRLRAGPKQSYLYAAASMELPAAGIDGVLFAARSIDATLLAELNETLGLRANMIGLDVFSGLTEPERSGERNERNQYFARINDDHSSPLLALQFDAAPRAFDDQFVTPTITVALIFALLSWLLVIFLMNRTVIAPINQVSKTMRQIRQSSDYSRKLIYPHADELGRLVNECNELLGHVAQQTQELRLHSYIDPLTQVGNRRLMQDQIGHIRQLCQRQQLPVSVIVFDLDYFKQYNDIYGHPAGDQALQQFAGVLKAVFKRETDLVVRSGGEEFIVILPGQEKKLAAEQAGKVAEALYKLNIQHRGNECCDRLTVSAGLASITPTQGTSIEQLMADADQALYRAKRQGRNRQLAHG